MAATASVQPSASAAPARRRRFDPSGYLFLLPSLLAFCVFIVFPVVASFYLTFTRYDILTPPTFIGLQNYVFMLTGDPIFWKAVTNTLYYVAVWVPLTMALGLFLSAFAWHHSPAQGMTALVCGALTLLTALISIYYPRVRYLTAVIALVLFVGSLTTAVRYDRTFWHNAVIAIVIFVIALVDRGTIRERRDQHDQLAQPIPDPRRSQI